MRLVLSKEKKGPTASAVDLTPRPRPHYVIRLFAVAEKRERTVPSRSARQGQNRPAVVIRPDWPSDVAGNSVRSIVEAITGQ